MSCKSAVIHLATAAAVAMAPASAATQCTAKFMASVDMITLNDGRIAIPVEVAGHPATFLVSLSNFKGGISKAFADSLKLPRGLGARGVELDGTFRYLEADVPSFGIGAAKHDRLLSLGYNNRGWTYGDTKVGDVTLDGTLGTQVIVRRLRYDMDLDFANHKLNLIERTGCADDELYWHPSDVLKLPVVVTSQISMQGELDGHHVGVMLNLAMPYSAVPAKFAKAYLGVEDGPAGNEKVGQLAADVPLYAHQFKTLRIGDAIWEGPKVILLPEPLEDPRLKSTLYPGPVLPEMMLGLEELRRHHVYIDFHHQTIYLAPLTEAARPAN